MFLMEGVFVVSVGVVVMAGKVSGAIVVVIVVVF